MPIATVVRYWGSLVVLLSFGAAIAGADVIETRDGRTLEGAIHFAGGSVYIKSDSATTRLKLDEIASLSRAAPITPTASAAPEPVFNCLMAEYFADTEFKKLCAVVPVEDTLFDFGRNQPNLYTPELFSVRFTGWIVPGKTGTYLFHINPALHRVQIGDHTFGADPAADKRGLPLEAGKRVPLIVEFRKIKKGDHARAGLRWQIEGEPVEYLRGSVLAAPDDFLSRLERFHRETLSGRWGGLKGEYFPDEQMQPRERILTRLDPGVDFNWPNPAAISPQLQDKFAACWTGKLKSPKTGTAKFSVTASARLTINNKVVIDAWPVKEGKSGPRSGSFDLKEGEMYDIKLEMVTGKGWGQMKFQWDFEHNWNTSIPAHLLYPPSDLPRGQILYPLDKASLDGMHGFPMRVAAIPGRGAIRKIEIVNKEGDKVLAEMTHAPYEFLIHPREAGEYTVYARVTNSVGSIGLTGPLKFSVTAAPSETLGGDWSIGRAGRAAAPSAAQNDGRIEVTGTLGSFGDQDRLPIVSRMLRGDGEIIAHLVELKTDKPQTLPLAGLTLRRSIDASSPHLSLLSSPTNGWLIASTERPQESYFLEKPIPLPIWLRLSRSGPIATASWSADGQTWTSIGSLTIGDDTDLLAGLTAMSLNSNEKVTGVFENVSIRSAEWSTLINGPGVQLINGSILAGKVTVGNAAVQVRTADNKTYEIQLHQVARIFHGPVSLRTANQIFPGWRGAILGNDLLEGEVSDLTPTGATITSIIFGISPVTHADGLSAVILKDVAPASPSTLIRHTHGQLRTANLRLESDHLIATDSILGDIRLSLADISALRWMGGESAAMAHPQ